MRSEQARLAIVGPPPTLDWGVTRIGPVGPTTVQAIGPTPLYGGDR
jgi:hypothetical protein